MKLSCSSLMLNEESFTSKARKLKELGYEGMSVFADYDSWTPAALEEIVNLESKTGIKVCEFVFNDDCYGHLMDSDESKRAKARKMYKEAAKICDKIGAVTELEFSYGPQDPLPVYHPYKKMTRNQTKSFMEMFAELQKPLEGGNGYMLLEDINRYESPYLNSMADCCAVVEEIGLPNMGILADFFHMSIEEQDICKAIYSAGDLIKHVHLGDTNRLMPGEGYLDWKKCFDALKGVGYEGYCSLECAFLGNQDEELLKTADYLLPLMK